RCGRTAGARRQWLSPRRRMGAGTASIDPRQYSPTREGALTPQQPEINPATIFRHAFGVYPSMAMLAGMQLDLFTPLKDGAMTEAALAHAVGVHPRKLRPLLY